MAQIKGQGCSSVGNQSNCRTKVRIKMKALHVVTSGIWTRDGDYVNNSVSYILLQMLVLKFPD